MPRTRAEESAADVHRPEARARRHSRARSKAIRCSSTTTRSIPNAAEVEDLKARYRAGKVGDVEVKTKLAAAINALLEPIRERREAALARPGLHSRGADRGSRRARASRRRRWSGCARP